MYLKKTSTSIIYTPGSNDSPGTQSDSSLSHLLSEIAISETAWSSQNNNSSTKLKNQAKKKHI